MKNIINILQNKKIMFITSISLVVGFFIIGLSIFLVQKNKLNNVAETLSNIDKNIIEENVIPDELIVDLSDESEENIEGQQENSINNISSSSNYYIKVNYQANAVTIYKKDANGVLQPFKAMICSTGTATPTSGVYYTSTKWVWGKLFGNVYGHYVTKIVGNILFHSVPYTAASPSSLEYWEYDTLGTSSSMGCVRLRVIDSKWIFDNIPSGTPVEFYASLEPGPLGKPGFQQISSNTQCRNWDPTDPSSNNPWKTYKDSVPNTSTTNSDSSSVKPESNKPTNTNQNLNTTINTNTSVENKIKNNTTTNTSTNSNITNPNININTTNTTSSEITNPISNTSNSSEIRSNEI